MKSQPDFHTKEEQSFIGRDADWKNARSLAFYYSVNQNPFRKRFSGTVLRFRNQFFLLAFSSGESAGGFGVSSSPSPIIVCYPSLSQSAPHRLGASP
ncbi:hypothetical protein YC2023_010455 [Brassica napus]